MDRALNFATWAETLPFADSIGCWPGGARFFAENGGTGTKRAEIKSSSRHANSACRETQSTVARHHTCGQALRASSSTARSESGKAGKSKALSGTRASMASSRIAQRSMWTSRRRLCQPPKLQVLV